MWCNLISSRSYVDHAHAIAAKSAVYVSCKTSKSVTGHDATEGIRVAVSVR